MTPAAFSGRTGHFSLRAPGLSVAALSLALTAGALLIHATALSLIGAASCGSMAAYLMRRRDDAIGAALLEDALFRFRNDPSFREVTAFPFELGSNPSSLTHH